MLLVGSDLSKCVELYKAVPLPHAEDPMTPTTEEVRALEVQSIERALCKELGHRWVPFAHEPIISKERQARVCTACGKLG